MRKLGCLEIQQVSGGEFGTEIDLNVPSGEATSVYGQALGTFLVTNDATVFAHSILENTAAWESIILNHLIVGDFVISPAGNTPPA